MILPLVALSLPGGPELIFIFFIVLLLFGAKKLPELARGLGKSLGEFKKAKEEFEREIHSSAAEGEAASDKPAGALPPAGGSAGLEVKEAPDRQPHHPG
ncbi:MAG: twin-arginine translocase TatA/TatE family subunit [Verrucomicrobiae bacterium]